MKVLVTGGCGFLGSHVCEYYRNKREEVVSIDNLTKYELMRTGYDIGGARSYNWNFLKGINVKLINGDISNKPEVLDAAKDCDFIVHTAAQPSMTISIEEPELDLKTNVNGTFNILEAARKYDIPVVNCSSIHVYGNEINKTLKEGATRFLRDPPAIDENYPIMKGSITPLHASKRTTELYVEAFIDTYNLDAATFRLTGMYGPRQFGGEDHGWVANFVIRTLLGLQLKVYGTDKQIRDILYASDAAAAFDAFYKHKKPGLYNIGGGVNNMISLGECLALIRKITNLEQNRIDEPARLGDLWYFVCDITKARTNLKWEPEVSTEEGITNLIKWVKENIGIFGGSGKS